MKGFEISSLELFAGAGGLSLGAAWAGARARALIDNSEAACEVLRSNVVRVHGFDDSVVRSADVNNVEFAEYAGVVDVLLAGAPCQPWSLAGRHRGPSDARNLFGQVIRAVAEIRPKVVVLENVRGLARPGFENFRKEFLEALSNPGGARSAHVKRGRARSSAQQTYSVVGPTLLNSADYGTAQDRRRVFIVAFRTDLGLSWSPPAPTHSQNALIRDQGPGGGYWERHGMSPRKVPRFDSASTPRPAPTESAGSLLPWRTVRDCLDGLTDPRVLEIPSLQHLLVRGAKRYAGHTGSDWDQPAKTLKAGVHGVPGGENMLRYSTRGHVRYFTIREAARLQDFPDLYRFSEVWSHAYRQIGNAVPVRLAHAVVAGILRQLKSASVASAA